MSERAVAILGVVLLLGSAGMLILLPRRSRALTAVGLAIGAGLFGAAIGIFAARQRPPAAPVGASATEPVPAALSAQPPPTPPAQASSARPPPTATAAPSPEQPAAPRFVETKLSLRFPPGDAPPTISGKANIADWYAYKNAIAYNPGPNEKLNRQQSQMLKLLVDVSWSWLVVLVFDQPTQYAKLNVNFTGGQLPLYQIPEQTAHFAVVHIQGRIPTGQMDISTGE